MEPSSFLFNAGPDLGQFPFDFDPTWTRITNKLLQTKQNNARLRSVSGPKGWDILAARDVWLAVSYLPLLCFRRMPTEPSTRRISCRWRILTQAFSTFNFREQKYSISVPDFMHTSGLTSHFRFALFRLLRSRRHSFSFVPSTSTMRVLAILALIGGAAAFAPAPS